jgi:hypothetical protein
MMRSFVAVVMLSVLPNWRNFEGSDQGAGLTGMLAG